MSRHGERPGSKDAEGTSTLQPFDPRFRGEWTWTQPARFRPRWELRCGDALVATLGTRGFLFRPSLATFADGSWEFRLRFPGGIGVNRAGDTESRGSFRPGWFSGGRVLRTGHDPLLWRRQDFWMRRWALLTEEQLPLVRFVVRPRFLSTSASLEIEDAARTLEDLPMLLALGWILVLLSHRGHGGYH